MFALIMLTVSPHGLSIGWLARRLELASPPRDDALLIGASPWSIDLAAALDKQAIPVVPVDSRGDTLRPARKRHIATHYGEVLSERTEEVLQLSHITKLIALTPNEAYNTMVCTRFGPELGRHNVFELGWPQADETETKLPSKILRGETLFDASLVHDELTRHHAEGWQFDTTSLSPQFGVKDALAAKPAGTRLIATIDSHGSIFFYPWADGVNDRGLTTLITYVVPMTN